MSASPPAGKTVTTPQPVGDGPARPPVVPHRWRKLAAVAAPLWADNNEGSVLSTLSPVIITALALPGSAVGVLVSVSKAIGVVVGPVWVWVARRIGRKAALTLSTTCVAVATAATGLAQDYTQLLLLWGLAAVFVAAGLPIVSEVTADLFDERTRGRANGYTWGAISLLGAVLGPLIGQLSRLPDGWRLGFFAAGAIDLVVAAGLVAGFQDPGVGASEPRTAGGPATPDAATTVLTWGKVAGLVRIPTFALMLGQRLVAGHLLVATFGVLFLVRTHGFTTAVASLVTLPYGVGYLVGTIAGGLVTDALHARRPRSGRVAVLQGAQFGFALFALLGTQADWHGIAVFALFWALMGCMQGVNPGVNRTIVTAVVPPELRGAAFALMLSVCEALAFVLFNLCAGFFEASLGLKTVMLCLPGLLMVANGLYCTALYRTYPRDVARLEGLLRARNGAAA
ncbi:MFS transporter [Streptomyces sp. NPDC059740]|uniref:MFS transporter n=1 Tax=Streptomyces sp. NPDC059740 TaxID=3346926 RepID=UPI003659D616